MRDFFGDFLTVADYIANEFAHHGFSGNGSLIKISDGQNINYLEKIDLVNTYNSHKVLNRAKSDILDWGYDS